MKKYFPPFRTLCEAIGTTPEAVKPGETIAVPAEILHHLIRAALSDLEIDPGIYREQNADLAAGFKDRSQADLESHFRTTGYFESRQLPIAFDPDYYVRQNRDVQTALRAKKLDNPLRHYYDQGWLEMRSPRRDVETPLREWAQTFAAAKVKKS
jgi:hypothetical protein